MLCMDGSDGFMLLASFLIADCSSNFKDDVDFGISLSEQSSRGCLASIFLLISSSLCVILLSFLFE